MGEGPPSSRLRRRRSKIAKMEIVILLVRADPKPVVLAAALARDGAVAAPNLNAVNDTFFLEAQGGMTRIGCK